MDHHLARDIKDFKYKIKIFLDLLLADMVNIHIPILQFNVASYPDITKINQIHTLIISISSDHQHDGLTVSPDLQDRAGCGWRMTV